MPTMRKFWKFVEARPCPVGTLCEWRQRTGEAFDHIRPLLRPTGKSATSYPNPNPRGLHLKIVHHSDGSIVAVCREGEDARMELRQEDIALHECPIDRIAAHIARALGVNTAYSKISSRIHRVGQWGAQPGRDFAVNLFLSASAPDLAADLGKQILSLSQPFIALTPTRTFWPSSELMKDHDSLIVPLDEVITDGWCASDAWAGYRETFISHALPDALVPAPPPYEFRKENSGWIIRFGGRPVTAGNLKGLVYIHYLLENPDRDIPVVEMLANIMGDERVRAVGNSGPVIDEASFQQYRKVLQDLQEEMDEARHLKDNAQVERIRKEMNTLATTVLKSRGLGGRKRNLADDVDKIRSATTLAIRRAIEKIQKNSSPCGEHLNDRIDTGATMRYRPERAINWVL